MSTILAADRRARRFGQLVAVGSWIYPRIVT